MILVVGGSGMLGRAVVGRLTSSGRQVRVLTRRPGSAYGPGTVAARGDLRDPQSLAEAMTGAAVVVSAAHGLTGGRGAGPEEVDDQGNAHLVRAAADAGVQHFVLLSVLDAGPDHPMSLHRAKYAAEQHLRDSGLSWTILRPSSYVETWIDIVGSKVPAGGPALVLGRGENPINFISVQDVATVVERAIDDPGLRGATIDLPGADNLTMTQLAQRLGASRIRHVPRPALRVLSTLLAPVAPAFARQSGAALVMDTTDMTAAAATLRERLPEVDWHNAAEVVDEYRTAWPRDEESV